MDFVKELLERFSRHHGRKLKLLEQTIDPGSEQLAKSAMATGKQQSASQAFANPITRPNGKPIYVWTTGKGDLVFSYQKSTVGTKNIQQNYEEFVNSFSQESQDPDQGDSPKKPQEPQLRPHEKAMEEAGINPELQSKLNELYALAYTAGSSKATGRSMVSVLVKDTPRLAPNEEGLYEITSSPVDQQVTEDVTDILTTLLSAEKGSLDEEFCSKVKRTNKGQAVIYPYEDDNGVVIGSRSISQLIEKEYQRKTECATSIIDLGANTDGSQSSIRGNLFESVTKIIGIGRALSDYEKNPPEDYDRKKAILEKMLKDEYAILAKRMGNLDEAVETWIADSEESTYSVDDAADAQLMVDIVKGDPRLIRALWYANSVSNRLRNPLLSIRVGGDVGAGKKADNVEIFASEEAAKAARDATFSKGNRPKLVKRKASEIFKNNPDELKNYIDAGRIESADQELYLTDISLKSIIADGPTKYGQTSPRSFMGFLRGRKPQDKFFRLFRGKMKSVFDNAESSTEFDRIKNEQKEIIDSVEKLAFNVATTGADGKSLSVNALGTALDSMMQNITVNSTFEELAKNKDYKSIKALQTRYNSTTNPKAKKALESKIKNKLTTFMLKKHTQANVQGVVDDPNASDDKKRGALAFGAAMAFKTGAANSDDVVMQKNHLKRGKSYYSMQNKNFNAIIDSIKKFPENEDGDFIIAPGAGVNFRKKGKGNSGKSVNTSFDPDGNLVNTQSWSLTEDSSDIHEFAPEIEAENSSTIIQALGKLHEALGIIKEKVRVLDAD